MSQEIDPMGLQARADALLQRASQQLRELLHQAAQALQPFPYFLGSDAVQAVEAEPPQGQGPERGCVVVCPDGELYEYTFSMSAGAFALGPFRQDALRKLELPPQDYIPYAYNALKEMARLLEEKETGPSQDRGLA